MVKNEIDWIEIKRFFLKPNVEGHTHSFIHSRILISVSVSVQFNQFRWVFKDTYISSIRADDSYDS